MNSKNTKATPAQQAVLDILAESNIEVCICYGDATWRALHAGVRMPTLNALVDRGLVVCKRSQSRRVYSLPVVEQALPEQRSPSEPPTQEPHPMQIRTINPALAARIARNADQNAAAAQGSTSQDANGSAARYYDSARNATANASKCRNAGDHDGAQVYDNDAAELLQTARQLEATATGRALSELCPVCSGELQGVVCVECGSDARHAEALEVQPAPVYNVEAIGARKITHTDRAAVLKCYNAARAASKGFSASADDQTHAIKTSGQRVAVFYYDGANVLPVWAEVFNGTAAQIEAIIYATTTSTQGKQHAPAAIVERVRRSAVLHAGCTSDAERASMEKGARTMDAAAAILKGAQITPTASEVAQLVQLAKQASSAQATAYDRFSRNTRALEAQKPAERAGEWQSDLDAETEAYNAAADHAHDARTLARLATQAQHQQRADATTDTADRVRCYGRCGQVYDAATIKNGMDKDTCPACQFRSEQNEQQQRRELEAERAHQAAEDAAEAARHQRAEDAGRAAYRAALEAGDTDPQAAHVCAYREALTAPTDDTDPEPPTSGPAARPQSAEPLTLGEAMKRAEVARQRDDSGRQMQQQQASEQGADQLEAQQRAQQLEENAARSNAERAERIARAAAEMPARQDEEDAARALELARFDLAAIALDSTSVKPGSFIRQAYCDTPGAQVAEWKAANRALRAVMNGKAAMHEATRIEGASKYLGLRHLLSFTQLKPAELHTLRLGILSGALTQSWELATDEEPAIAQPLPACEEADFERILNCF